MPPVVKPPLVLPSSAGNKSVNAAECAECAAKFLGQTGFIFRKGAVLVRLVGDRLEVVTLAVLQTLLFSLMTVCKWAMVSKEAAVVPATEIREPTLKMILGSIFVFEFIPNIAIVLANPTLVLVEGKLVELKPGYNAVRGGMLVTGSASAVRVNVEVAVFMLKDLLIDFSFTTASDMSRAIGAIFSAAMRLAGVFERSPLLAIEANDSQTGKGLFWCMICAIFGQRPGTVAQKKGGVGSLDESIMEKLVAGVAFLLLDNMKGAFDSAFLEAALTVEAGMIDARVPGIRAVPVDPRLVVFGLTSNGVELTPDMANRTLMIRLRKQNSLYEFHTWTDRDGNEVGIRQHIEAYQATYLACVNAILRDWWENGAQRLPCPEHSFKETLGAVDYIAQHYFGLAPLMAGHTELLDRTAKPGLSWLRQIALKAADSWAVVDWSASRLAERCMNDGIAIPGSAGMDPENAAKAVGIAMSQAFGSEDLVVIDGIAVKRVHTTDTDGRPRKVYSFSRAKS